MDFQNLLQIHPIEGMYSVWARGRVEAVEEVGDMAVVEVEVDRWPGEGKMLVDRVLVEGRAKKILENFFEV